MAMYVVINTAVINLTICVFQCEQVANELATVLQQRRTVLRSLVDLLRTYATIVSHVG